MSIWTMLSSVLARTPKKTRPRANPGSSPRASGQTTPSVRRRARRADQSARRNVGQGVPADERGDRSRPTSSTPATSGRARRERALDRLRKRHEFGQRTVVTTEAVGTSTWPDTVAATADTDALFVVLSAPFPVAATENDPGSMRRLVTWAVVDDISDQLRCRQRAVPVDGDLPTEMREQVQERSRVVIGPPPSTEPAIDLSVQDVASWLGARDATIVTGPPLLSSIEGQLGLTRDGLVADEPCARLAERALSESDATRRQRLLVAALESARIDMVATIAAHEQGRSLVQTDDDEQTRRFDLAS